MPMAIVRASSMPRFCVFSDSPRLQGPVAPRGNGSQTRLRAGLAGSSLRHGGQVNAVLCWFRVDGVS